MPRPDYGIDAPGLVRFFSIGGTVSGVLAITLFAAAASLPAWTQLVAGAALVPALYMLGMTCLMIYGSKVIKVRERERLLDTVGWQGDERVLDVGCGRGLMLVGAARRLTSGCAIGVDIWQAEDQSANTPDAAVENARREGVADRIAVQTADMRALPFADASFDIIVTNWVVHNLKAEQDRLQALTEMMRVVRPTGTIILSDIEHRRAYATILAAGGWTRQQLIVDAASDAFMKIVTFGSFAPAAIVARREP